MSQPNIPQVRLLAAVLSISLLFTACKKNVGPDEAQVDDLP